ncbi:hypothetical protein BGZ65_009422, partial [Modicella reniformis]
MARARLARATRTGDMDPIMELALEGLVVVTGNVTVAVGRPLVVMIAEVGREGPGDDEGHEDDDSGTPVGASVPPGEEGSGVSVGTPVPPTDTDGGPPLTVVTDVVGLAAPTIVADMAKANTSEAKTKHAEEDRDFMLNSVVLYGK